MNEAMKLCELSDQIDTLRGFSEQVDFSNLPVLVQLRNEMGTGFQRFPIDRCELSFPADGKTTAKIILVASRAMWQEEKPK